MPLREDLAYEKSGTEVPYLYTDARDMDEALTKASFALRDVQSFWDCARANGAEAVASGKEAERLPGATIKAGYFVLGAGAGVVGTVLLLLSLGVI